MFRRDLDRVGWRVEVGREWGFFVEVFTSLSITNLVLCLSKSISFFRSSISTINLSIIVYPPGFKVTKGYRMYPLGGLYCWNSFYSGAFPSHNGLIYYQAYSLSII